MLSCNTLSDFCLFFLHFPTTTTSSSSLHNYICHSVCAALLLSFCLLNKRMFKLWLWNNFLFFKQRLHFTHLLFPPLTQPADVSLPSLRVKTRLMYLSSKNICGRKTLLFTPSTGGERLWAANFCCSWKKKTVRTPKSTLIPMALLTVQWTQPS